MVIETKALTWFYGDFVIFNVNRINFDLEKSTVTHLNKIGSFQLKTEDKNGSIPAVSFCIILMNQMYFNYINLKQVIINYLKQIKIFEWSSQI